LCQSVRLWLSVPYVGAGNWLRNYVYDRVEPFNKKPGFYALLVTQTVSGVWHGLYAGYWLFFVHSAFMLQGSRFLFKLVSAAPKRTSRPRRARERERGGGGLVGSHGRWKRPCLQTAHMTI
jgi:hypothetical protein